ncbi:COBRA-like protein 10 [Impatiens glandulifera]|uniref:COBRA-like protein 10 n=1 Tax=Impatiens glandulifera TaxID=253017 RepID=UPI001FB11DE4|nr:COBRA-like protein 10 [Impatiens glandulifera]
MNLWKVVISLTILLSTASTGQTQDDTTGDSTAPPPAANDCNGFFLSYTFISREKEYPHLKNASAQPWAFKSVASILNTGKLELKAWKMFIGFHQQEILVSAGGGVLLDGNDFPASVGVNGTYIGGYPQTDLKTAIDTANDLTQIQARVEFKGTQFGLRAPGVPMPKTIKLENDGYKCPAPTRHGKSSMYACCVRNPKLKGKNVTTKYTPRQKADLTMSYDILTAYGNNYLAQVELQNNNPLGKLDHWNLTWEWQRGEFISSMRGAYTHLKDGSGCIFGAAGQQYQDFDFSQVQNCEKKPTITDMPPDKANDDKLGKLPYCCRNGSLLPTTMSKDKSKAVFQLQVYKISPDTSRIDLYPPANWKIVGTLNPSYKCSQPIRVDPQEYPDKTGLQEITRAIASWQVACNITRPKLRNNRCCVSFSSYYNDSAIPCSTCACGCENAKKCNQHAKAMLLPTEALLVPFSNRSVKAKAWAKINHFRVPKPLPCGDNCGVSINWHLNSNHKSGWTGRITLFNWEDINFEDWFVALQFKKSGKGFQKAYSFNGTMLKNPNNTIFMQGVPGMTYLMAETNGSKPGDPRIPGKQQSVLSFEKRFTWGLKVSKGDGFPSRVYFNGEECQLPKDIPTANGRRRRVNIVMIVVLVVTDFLLLRNQV